MSLYEPIESCEGCSYLNGDECHHPSQPMPQICKFKDDPECRSLLQRLRDWLSGDGAHHEFRFIPDDDDNSSNRPG